MQRPDAPAANGMGHLPTAILPEIDSNLAKCLTMFATQTAFTISSCRLPDMPIVYASPQFCAMSGYCAREVVGRNCRFLQGPGTSRQSVLEIRDSIQEDRGCTVCILNYTKDQKPFWNQLCLSPVKDEHGVVYYLGIQTNVTGAVLSFRTQMYSPFNTTPAGPHGGVHSFKGCSDITAKEVQVAKQLSSKLQRWHSEKLQDPNLPDMPIVHASEGFLRLTGRPRHKVVGHNCRFMRGPGTDSGELQRLRTAISQQRPVTVSLINYRHDGTCFWNHLHVAPIRNSDGQVVFFVGVQLDITRTADATKPQEPADSATCSGNSDINTSVGVSADPSLPERSPNGNAGVSLSNQASSRTTQEDPGHHLEEATTPQQYQHCNGHSGGHESAAATCDMLNGSRDLPEPREEIGPTEKQMQRSIVGTVRVVCRSLSTKSGLRRSFNDQHRPHAGDLALTRLTEESQAVPSRLDTPTLGSSHI